jgi:hypothetical protein
MFVALLIVNAAVGSRAMGALTANIGDTVQATLTASGSIVGTGGTQVDLWNVAQTSVQSTVYTNQGGLFHWTNVFVNGQSQGANDFYTACIEILQTINWGTSFTYTVADLASAPVPGALNGEPTGMGSTAAAAINALWQDHYASVGTDNTLAGALQLATWKLVYDQGSTLSFSSGRLRATQNSGSELTTASSWLSSLTGNNSLSVAALVSNDSQDQAFAALPAVPEPSSILVWCLLGAVSVVGCYWRGKGAIPAGPH